MFVLDRRSGLRRAALACIAAGVLLAAVRPLAADSTARGSSSRMDRHEAVNAIPFDRLTEEMQQRLRDVVANPSIYRRLPVQEIHCDPDMHLFLLRYPEVVVDIWRLMGITRVSSARTGPFSVRASDGVGTESDVELVYGTHGLHVFYGEGSYEGPLLKQKIKGRCVLLLRTSYARDADDRVQITDQLDMFLQVDHAAAELVARTLSPLVGKSADYNFTESLAFISRLSEAAENNGPGVQRLSEKLTNVDPQVRGKFSDIAELVYHRAIVRESSSANGRNINMADSQNADPVHFKP